MRVVYMMVFAIFVGLAVAVRTLPPAPQPALQPTPSIEQEAEQWNRKAEQMAHDRQLQEIYDLGQQLKNTQKDAVFNHCINNGEGTIDQCLDRLR